MKFRPSEQFFHVRSFAKFEFNELQNYLSSPFRQKWQTIENPLHPPIASRREFLGLFLYSSIFHVNSCVETETFAFFWLYLKFRKKFIAGVGVGCLPSISDLLSHAEKVINPDSEPKIFLDLQEKSLDKLPSRMDVVKNTSRSEDKNVNPNQGWESTRVSPYSRDNALPPT